MKNGLIIAVIGIKQYYLNDELHRVDGPAIECNNGTKLWYLNGKLHRVDGPAEENTDGTKRWWLNGERHRVDGPTEEYTNGNKFWYLHGKIHRGDGPAEEYANGDKHWYLHGTHLTQPKSFDTMEEWFQELNDNEEYSLQWISDINGIIGFIKKPSGKQTRLNAMRWKI